MRSKNRAFTLIELLVVMIIIVILTSLILEASRYIRQKAAAERADGEIHGLETACESYKTDNGAYPDSTAVVGGASTATDTLDPRVSGNPVSYEPASIDLYKLLSGDSTNTGTIATGSSSAINYMADMPQLIYYRGPNQTTGPILYLMDPFGNSYGYSTIYNYTLTSNTASATAPTVGYNPTFDLWSTAGNSTAPSPGQPNDITLKWIKNWQ